jgi:hypothetical protein
VEIAAAGAGFTPAVQLAVAVVAGEAVSGKRLYRALPGWAAPRSASCSATCSSISAGGASGRLWRSADRDVFGVYLIRVNYTFMTMAIT